MEFPDRGNKEAPLTADTIWPEAFPVLEGERVVLRRVRDTDAAGIFRCYSDPDIMRYIGTPLDDPECIQGIVEDYFLGQEEGTSLVWAIEEKHSGEFTGTAGFESFSFLDCCAETGFTLLKEYRRQGYMTEAMEAIIAFAFRELRLNRIEARIHPDNAPALRLAERLGFTLEGTLRQSVYFDGEFHDQMVLSIIREDMT